MPISAEITYGLERITAMITNKDNIFDIEWTQGVPYGSVRLTEEQQFSRYSFESADVELHFQLLSQYETEAKRMLEAGLLFPAYDFCLKCSHIFNTLEARGAISITERTGIIARIRNLVCGIAAQYIGAKNHG